MQSLSESSWSAKNRAVSALKAVIACESAKWNEIYHWNFSNHTVSLSALDVINF